MVRIRPLCKDHQNEMIVKANQYLDLGAVLRSYVIIYALSYRYI